MSFNSSSGSNSTNTTENEAGIGGGIIWVIIFLLTLAFFTSIKLMVCCTEFRKYRNRVPFKPGEGNYPKQPPPDVPPPRDDQVTGGDYPRQEYFSLDQHTADECTQNLEANLDLSQIVSAKETLDRRKSHHNPKTLDRSGDIELDNQFETIPAGALSSSENTAVRISENCSISFPTPEKKSQELPPIESKEQRRRGHISTINVSYSEPLPAITEQNPASKLPDVSSPM